MSEAIRFSVERPVGQREDGQWNDVGADGGFQIDPSGALVFHDADGEVLLAYAPHAWVTVTPEA